MLAARVEQKNGTYVHNIQTDIQSSPHLTGVAMFGINPDRRSQGVENRQCRAQETGELSVGTAIAANLLLGTCAQDARREPTGSSAALSGNSAWSRHARCRSRRYRARGQCVTDHSPPNEQKAGPFLELEVGEALSERSRSRRSPLQWLCHHCRRSASEFVRLSPLRPRRSRRKNGQIGRRRALSIAVHPDGASQDGLPALPRIHRKACTGLCPDGWLTAFLPGHLSTGRRQRMYCSSAPPTRLARFDPETVSCRKTLSSTWTARFWTRWISVEKHLGLDKKMHNRPTSF